MTHAEPLGAASPTLPGPGHEPPTKPLVPTAWRGPGSRRAKVACISAIVAKSIYGLVLLPLTPSLIGTHPVLLEALRGTTSAMATGGAFARVGQASLVLAILAPIPTLFFVIPFCWWAGRLWGPEVAATLAGGNPKAERWAQRTEARLERFGGATVALAFFLPIPSALIYAAAGWTGMALRRFVLFALLGTLLWIGVIVGLGYGVGQPAVRVAKAISHYGLLFTVGLVVVVVAVSMARARRAAAMSDGQGG